MKGIDLASIESVMQAMPRDSALSRRLFFERPEHRCTNTEVRQRAVAGGGIQVSHQCLDCGVSVGPYLRHSEVDLSETPSWDETIREGGRARVERERERLETVHAANKLTWKQWYYGVYLKSAHWRKLRLAKLDAVGGVCEGCGGEAAVVHHTRAAYRHLGAELLYELRALCRRCHDVLHPEREDIVDDVANRLTWPRKEAA